MNEIKLFNTMNNPSFIKILNLNHYIDFKLCTTLLFDTSINFNIFGDNMRNVGNRDNINYFK